MGRGAAGEGGLSGTEWAVAAFPPQTLVGRAVLEGWRWAP